LFSTIYI